MYQRIQGKEFEMLKNLCRLDYFSVSNNGNVRAFMTNKVTHKKYMHWLTDEEKVRFYFSSYINECYKKKELLDNVILVYGKPNENNKDEYDLEVKFDKTLIKIPDYIITKQIKDLTDDELINICHDETTTCNTCPLVIAILENGKVICERSLRNSGYRNKLVKVINEVK